MSDLGNKEIFAKNLNYYMNLNHKDRNNISKDLDLPYTTVTSWCKGEFYPRIDKIQLLANYFNISKSDLVENKEKKEVSSHKFYMCPVYGQISAGQPNWAEECIEERIPIAPKLLNLSNSEEYFLLRVNGESMNKIIKNNALALIHKQDIVENGEIAVVLIDGYDATLKKFIRQNDLILLEPQSTDENFITQVYDKNTTIKILGKYIGKIEMNG